MLSFFSFLFFLLFSFLCWVKMSPPCNCVCPSQKILTVNLVDGKRKGKKKKERKKKAEAFKPDGTLGSLRVTKGQCQTPQYGVALWVCAGGCGDGAMEGLEGGAMGYPSFVSFLPVWSWKWGSGEDALSSCPIMPLLDVSKFSSWVSMCHHSFYFIFHPFCPCNPLSDALSFRNDNGTCSERVALVSSPFYLFKIIIILIPFKKLNGMGWDRGNIQTRLSF